MLTAREIVVDGVRAHVRQAGDEESSEAVVFVHGNPGPSDDWDFAAAGAGALCRAVLIDMPGYGRADRPRDFDYTVEGYAHFLDGVLAQLGVREVHLVMHDFGGGWGLRWATEHPTQVRSLTLINTGVLFDYVWHDLARVWQTPIVGELVQLFTTRNLLRRELNRLNPKPMPPEFVDRIFQYADWGHKRAVLKLYRNSKDYEAIVQPMVRAMAPWDVPTLVLWGAGDTYLPVAHAQRQAEVFPSAEIHILQGCGHWPFIDDPDAVREPMLRFLREQVGSSPSPRDKRAQSGRA